jgi:hypothetical protein
VSERDEPLMIEVRPGLKVLHDGPTHREIRRLQAIERAAREYLAALDAFSADGSSRKIDTGLLHQCSKAKEAIRLALDAK